MLKPQDIVILLKIIAHSPVDKGGLSQIQLAHQLCMSASEVNAGIKRLMHSKLLRREQQDSGYSYIPIVKACEEFLISGLKYVFPAQMGQYSRGIATSYASPIFSNKLILGNEPVPVWPYVEGDVRGIEIKPLYSSVPKSLALHPDQAFYDLLALVDAIRHGRARERAIAIDLLKDMAKSFN